jgi:hypothetical protein
MEESCSTGQSPQWAVVSVEEEEEEALLSNLQYLCAILSSVACPGVRYFSTLCLKRSDFRLDITGQEMCVLIPSISLVETFLIRKRTERDIIINMRMSSGKVPVHHHRLYSPGWALASS